ncbi:MAG: PorT family protein [Bacteroidetes bacterium]|jgi:hypothetical protein|nr:PorT family protein [Bacteroidota bacterium]MBT6685992.1 PorT family protein [Bacteroidota bacterium]MBT7143774.1 PorT family protein [Bacteroidota bacterium]MBT7490873.1 PorT family protein [Bacteroidota bacterium]
MKKVLVLTVAVFLTIGLLAQEADTTKIKLGTKKILIIENPDGDSDVVVDTLEEYDYDIDEMIEKKKDKDDSEFDAHWAGFEFGLNNYLNSNNELVSNDELHASSLSKSWGFNLNLLEFDFPVIKENFGFVTGLGFEWNNYRFENNFVALGYDENGSTEWRDEGIEYQKNKLNTTYLTAPLLMEFQAPVGKKQEKLSISVGVIGGLKLHSNSHYEYEIGDGEYDLKEKTDYNLSSFRYGVTARIGYDNVQLFANYNITPMFESDKGPELYPFTIGIHILDF